MTIAFFPYGEPELEAFGLRLLHQVSAVLRHEFNFPELPSVPIGPEFDYGVNPALFLSRRGRGPLHVVWDTNLLIDYFDYGASLWELGLPDDMPDYADELEALQFIIAMWVIRDVRFHVLPRVLVDAKRRLTAERFAERANALEQFAAALRLVGDDDDERINVPGFGGEMTATLERLRGVDRALIKDAVDLGAHVFLTRDKPVLKCRPDLIPFGLLIASPGDLLEQLAGCGAFHCLCAPRYACWPLPDQARVTHLVKVLRQVPESRSTTQ